MNPAALLIISSLLTLASPPAQQPDGVPSGWQGRLEVAGGLPHIHNPPTPSEAPRPVRLVPVWRTGSDPREGPFGRLAGVAADSSGCLYLLDRQMKEVRAYGSQGAFLGALSRPGEGPGELRNPRSLIVTPDGLIAVAEFMPGRLVRLHADGTPAGDIDLQAVLPEGSTVVTIHTASRGPNQYILEVRLIRMEKQRRIEDHRLIGLSFEGEARATYLESRVARDPGMLLFTDRRDSFERGHWVALSDGRLAARLHRDTYEIGIFTPDGVRERVIHCDGVPRVARTQAELDELEAEVTQSTRGRPPGYRIETDFSPYRPTISRLWAGPHGELWVRSCRHDRELPTGISERIEVFNREGHFVRELLLALPGGSLPPDFFVLDELLFVLEEHPDPDETGGVAAQVTCYRISVDPE